MGQILKGQWKDWNWVTHFDWRLFWDHPGWSSGNATASLPTPLRSNLPPVDTTSLFPHCHPLLLSIHHQSIQWNRWLLQYYFSSTVILHSWFWHLPLDHRYYSVCILSFIWIESYSKYSCMVKVMVYSTSSVNLWGSGDDSERPLSKEAAWHPTDVSMFPPPPNPAFLNLSGRH